MSKMDDKGYVQMHCLLLPRTAMVLRELFRKRWRMSGKPEWQNNVEQGKIFGEGKQKQVLKGATKRQQDLLYSGNVDTWDLNLLCRVLRKMNFDNANFTKYEKTKIDELSNARAEIARYFPIEHFGHTDFIRVSGVIQENLMVLGHIPTDFLNLKIAKFSPEDFFPNVAEKLASEIRSFQKEHMIKTIAYCTARLKKSSVLNNCEISALFTVRSQTYLSLAKAKDDPIGYELMMAKEDAKVAIIWNSVSSFAYTKLGEIYCVLDKKRKATKNFAIARKLKEYVLEVNKKKRFNRNRKPTTAVSTETKLEKNFAELNIHTDDVPEEDINIESYEEVELYTTLADKGNADALYSLGILHCLGRGGLKVNFAEGEKLLLEAASKPAFIKGKPNPGVAKAEHALAFNYDHGLGGLAIDKRKAVNMYIKAIDHGHVSSCNNLGYIYCNGLGIDKNIEKALWYWEIAACNGDLDAMVILGNYYLDVGDLDRATIWQTRALDGKSLHAEAQNSKFMDAVNKLKHMKTLDKTVIEWEKENKLDATKLNKEGRRKRYLESVGFSGSPEEFAKELPLDEIPEGPTASRLIPDRFHFNLIEDHCLKGSVTAELLKKAVTHFATCLELLDKHELECPPTFIEELANCIRLEYSVITWTKCQYDLVVPIVEKALNKSESTSELNMNARICYAYFNSNKYDEMKIFLNECISTYPQEVMFRIMICYTLNCLDEFEKGRELATEALKIFPNDCELLFVRALNLSLSEPNLRAIIDAFQQFIDAVPSDHGKVPEAYYSTAFECAVIEPEEYANVKKYYQLAKNSETLQLPFYLPCKCLLKFNVEEYMKNPFK